MGFQTGKIKPIAWLLLFLIVFSQGAIADSFQEKLRGGLNPELLETETENVFLIVPLNNADIPAIQNELTSRNAFFSFQRIGTVFIAKIASNRIPELAQNSAVKEIWPDVKVNATDETALQQINAPTAWELGYRGNGIKIAVLDSGIDASHPVFQDRIIAAHNFSDSPTVSDILGHGTHVAGIAAGSGDTNGVAPEAFLLNGKVLNDDGSGTFSTVINGINWAIEENAQVINLSLGAPSHDLDSPLNRAVQDAMNAGVVVVIASGNCWTECPSSSCGSFRGVTLPGNTLEALTVGAVDAENRHACFSSGETIGGIGIKPDVVAPGVGISSSIPSGLLGTKSGTSMATPFASGAAALIKQAHPSFLAFEIKALLQNTATDLGETGKDILFGSGLLDLSRIESLDSNAPDANQEIPDSNQESDVNGSDGPFVFWGPEELEKNQEGEFDVEHLGGGGLEQDWLQQAPTKDTLVEFSVLDEFGNLVEYGSAGPTEVADLNNYHFTHSFVPKRTGNFTVQAAIFQEGQLVQSLSGKETIGSASAEKKVLVTLPSELLEIEPFSIPPLLQKGSVFSIPITVNNTGELDTNAFIELRFLNDQNSIAEALDSEALEIPAHQSVSFSIEKPVFIPAGNYTVLATVFFENREKTMQFSSQVTVGNAIEITSVQIPSTVPADTMVPISVTVRNKASFSLQPSVHAQIMDGNTVLERFFDGGLVLEPGQETALEWNWLAKEPAKQYRFRLEAQSEDSHPIQEIPVQIVDENPPSIETPSFSSTVWQNGFLNVHARATDFSPIQSVFLKNGSNEYSMKKQPGSDSNSEFSGALPETDSLGTGSFSIQACDEFSNCFETAPFSFSVQSIPIDCENRFFLAVKDNDSIFSGSSGQEWINNLQSIPGCFSEWSTQENGIPPLSLLQRFDAVLWSTGNHFGSALDENESALLKNFLKKNGRLLLEGSDVSSEHGFDETAYTVLHGEFALEIGQDENFGVSG